MLLEATRSRLVDAEDSDYELARAYLEGFRRLGDFGLIAEVEGKPAGAAWARSFDYEEPGLAFVAPFLPELVIAVSEDYRRQGIGSKLLIELLKLAKENQCAFVTAAVGRNTPGQKLLMKFGFADAGLTSPDEQIKALLGCV